MINWGCAIFGGGPAYIALLGESLVGTKIIND